MAENETPNTGQERIAELEGLLAGKDEELNKANDRLGKLDDDLKQAVASYKTLIVKSNPDVLPELLSGESITALDNSLARSKELVVRIKSKLEEQVMAMRIPAGAPQRKDLDTGDMSPREKIRWGIVKGSPK
jgi:bisphosphoglycerate-dependent phosphoglycerate mutase